LLTAIDRKRILEQELLGGAEVPGCREVSGPFPAGAGDTDPLGYAYDSSIPPHAYDPYLAKLLARIAQNQVAAAAAAGDEPPPKLAPLVLGHPAHEVARVACQAIASHWRAIGLETKLQEFPPGVVADPAGACDLVYAEVAIWEPVVDADRLLGITGPAATENTYVRQALRWLNQAQSWDEVRKRLLELHRAVQSEAAVLPLWQLVDFFSYGKRLRNVGQHPVWLYQKVDEWQLGEVSE
jgi:ABC-type transport system substrate-binding protein